MKKTISITALCFILLMLVSCKKEADYYLKSFALGEEEEKIVLDLVGKDDITLVTEEDIADVTEVTVAGKSVRPKYWPVNSDSDEFWIDENEKNLFSNGGYGNEISVLKIFPNIEKLRMYFLPQLTDISFIEELSLLETLSINMVNVRDFSAVQSLRELQIVSITACPAEKIAFHPANRLTNVSIVSGCIEDGSVFGVIDPSLTSFVLENNKVKIENLDVIKKFHRLSNLSVSAPDFDYSLFAEMPATVKSLSVGCSKIDLSCVKHMKYLESVEIFNMDEVDLTPLDELEMLGSVYTFNIAKITHGEKTNANGEIWREIPPKFVIYDMLVDEYTSFYN